MPITLAIETSQRSGGVALRTVAGEVHVEPLAPTKRHDDDLMPAIDRLFKRLDLNANDLRGGAVCVSIGPGGFTGLRIAVSVAKMFAEALGAKTVAVPSSLVAAEALDDESPLGAMATAPRSIIVALACKAATCWCTHLARNEEDGWRIIGQPSLRDALHVELQGVHAVLADAYLPEPMRRLCESSGVPVIQPRLNPRACLAAGERLLAANQTVDPLALMPLYPREPEAVTLWKSRLSERQTG